MVSYVRARAEGLGLEVKTGLMARPERVLLLVVGLIIGGAAWLLWVIGILAVTSTYTSVQRIVVVWRTIRREQIAPAAPPNVGRERSNMQDSSASDTAAQDGHTPRRDTSSTLGLRKPGSAPR
jgi:CDP-diacylglycerol--glycerol-3-phosphate 3-phosphatidyltransferase